jgi:iron-sulfur cluster repair protein YtfE (RIC family)
VARQKRRLAKRAAKKPLDGAKLGELIARSPEVLHLLDEYGITFCAGCYLTLMSSPERAAVYHAVPKPKRFLKALQKALK